MNQASSNSSFKPIYDMISDFDIRFLTMEDLGKYMDMVNSHTSLNSIELTSDQRTIEISLAEEKFYDAKNRIAGAFDSHGNLVTAISGYYHENFSHWYIYRVYQKREQLSLNDIFKNCGLLFLVSKHLVDYAESINRYTYYNKFAVKHQVGWEKAHYILTTKFGLKPRYHYCWEDVYMPGETCRSINHKFFFPSGFEVTTVPSIININMLLPDLRREIFSNKQQIVLDKHYLIQGF